MTAPGSGSGRTLGDGKYELLAPVGLGAMGVVHLARHVALDRIVAVKLLNPGLTSSAEAAERFIREARAASLLRHKNTVHVLDFGGDPATGCFLVMEYVEGRNLAEVLAEDGTIAPARAIRIGAQVLAALAEAHEFEIVHRDIKPANVMLVPWTDDDGHETELVKVLDFGIATMRSEPRWHMREEVAGTPEYMSPEQAQGLEVDARSDVYAVATLLYAMICGEVPFARESAMETMVAQVSAAPRPPRTLAPHISEGLERVLLKALAKRPEDRYAHARAFRTALLELPEGQTGPHPVVASAPPTRPALPPVVAPAPPTPAPMPAAAPTSASAPAPASSRRGLLLALLALAAAGVLIAWGAGAFESGAPAAVASPGPRTPIAPESVAAATPRAEPPPAPVLAPEPEPKPEPKPEPETAPPTVAVTPMPVPEVPVAVTPTSPEPAREKPKTKPTEVAPKPPSDVTPAPKPPPIVSAVDAPKPPTNGPVAPPATTPPTDAPTAPNVVVVPPIEVPAPVDLPKPVEKKKALSASAAVSGLAVEGSLPRSSVARALDGATAALEQCYRTAAVAADDDASGSASVHIEIDIDGRARNVAVGALPLPGLQACAAAAIGRVRTKDRPDTGTVGATFRVTFTPRPAQ